MLASSSHASDLDSESPRCSDGSASVSDWPAEPRLRGLRWRVLLGVLPSCPASIEALRRAAANGRRRYAELRRRLIIDPHTLEDGHRGENLSVNNPLSQDPDSVWRHYFKNTELEKTIENDLTRLYPEHGSFFRGSSCQSMLKRILLVWALSHAQYGYKQGMHELLAPLVYALHLDVTHLSQVRQRYEDPFEDRFDAYEEKLSVSREARQAVPSFTSRSHLEVSDESALSGGEEWIYSVHPDDLILLEPDEFGFNLKTMLLGSDSYGAEGELGALLSGRFLEHDAYCMFDALLRGHKGEVALADYFVSATEGKTGLSPVLEASETMYNTLAIVDTPLYIHLVEIGVEPQFFALRWFRVLFGREFDLEMLLHLWDAILASSYPFSANEDKKNDQGNIEITRGSFISIFAVSMIQYLRSTLLAAPNATVCLQKLLNFPKHVDVRNLIENVKVLQMVSEESSRKAPSSAGKRSRFFEQTRGRNRKNRSPSPSFQVHIPTPSKVLPHRHSGSPEVSRHARTESYWEERWMSSVLPKDVQEDVCEDADATVSGSTSGNESGNNILEGHVVSDTSVDNKQSTLSNGNTPIQDNNKPAKRSLFATLWNGATQLMSFEGRKVDAAVSSSENKTSVVVAAANTESQNKTEGEGATSSGAESDPNGGFASTEKTLEVAGSDVWTSDDGETSSSGDEGGRLHCASDQRGNVSAERVSTHPLEAVGFLTSSADTACHLDSQQDSMSRQGMTTSSSDSREENEVVDGTHEAKNDGKIKERHSKAVLQTLGQSMVESIQVIESALSGFTKDGASTPYRETAENLSKALLNGKGHITALSALAELRKISSLLLQM